MEYLTLAGVFITALATPKVANACITGNEALTVLHISIWSIGITMIIAGLML